MTGVGLARAFSMRVSLTMIRRRVRSGFPTSDGIAAKGNPRHWRLFASLPIAALGCWLAMTVWVQAIVPVPLSLEFLSSKADVVLLARTIGVQEKGGREAILGVFPVRTTRFQVIASVKPLSEKDPTKPAYAKDAFFELDEFAKDEPRPQDSSILLLYLTKKSEVGFRSPLGEFAGEFRRAPGPPADGRLMVQNLVSNRALWGNQPGQTLWGPTTFPREVAESYLTAYLRERNGSSRADSVRTGTAGFIGKVSKRPNDHDQVEDILKFGDEPCQPRPVPAELLLAATHAWLAAHPHHP
jgi:hypothetical protein